MFSFSRIPTEPPQNVQPGRVGRERLQAGTMLGLTTKCTSAPVLDSSGEDERLST